MKTTTEIIEREKQLTKDWLNKKCSIKDNINYEDEKWFSEEEIRDVIDNCTVKTIDTRDGCDILISRNKVYNELLEDE